MTRPTDATARAAIDNGQLDADTATRIIALEHRARAIGRTLADVHGTATEQGWSLEDALDRLEELEANPEAKALAEANATLGLTGDRQLTAILKEPGDEPDVILVGHAGQGRVTHRQFHEWRFVAPAITGATGDFPPEPSMPRAEWWRIARVLNRAAQVIDLGDEATDAGLMRAWLDAYLEDWPPDDADRDETLSLYRPYRDGATVLIPTTGFAHWLRTHKAGEHRSARELARMARAAGGEPVRIDVATGGSGRTVRRCWKFPR